VTAPVFQSRLQAGDAHEQTVSAEKVVQAGRFSRSVRPLKFLVVKS
jgi:hypothetical protein